MDRKAIAQETVKIQNQGYYALGNRKIDFYPDQRHSEEASLLVTPQQAADIVRTVMPSNGTGKQPTYSVLNQSTVRAIIDQSEKQSQIGVLNFASAKNPGGGFLNGSMAQEEALAISSGLYNTLIKNPTYYNENQKCKTMMYTDHAIYSPDVVFFRDEQFHLLNTPVTASVLTMPAVNMNQVIKKQENVAKAKEVMINRMRICLAIFAHQQSKNLILGAYGCGVFGNDPSDIAKWWSMLLRDEGYGEYFDSITFAILDKSGSNITQFQQLFK